MENNEIYASMDENEGLKLPSYMGIIPREKDYILDKNKLRSALEANKEFKVKSFEMTDIEKNKDAVMNFCFDIEIEFEDIDFDLRIAAYKTEGLDLHSYSFANTIDEESLKIATEQPYCLEVSMLFSDNPMSSFLFQLKVLHTIMPKASLVVDFSSMRLLSPHWLTMLLNQAYRLLPITFTSYMLCMTKKTEKHNIGCIRTDYIDVDRWNWS